MSNLDISRELIAKALTDHIKGKNATERLERATSDVLGAIAHLISVRTPGAPQKRGVTIMTEGASMSPIAPRTI